MRKLKTSDVSKITQLVSTRTEVRAPGLELELGVPIPALKICQKEEIIC